MAESLYDNLFPQETQPRAATASATGGLYNDLFPAEQQQPRYQQTLSQSPEVWRQRLNFDAREDRQGLPRGTMTRLVRLESGGDPTAVSGAGAQGLWQLMPGTAAVYKVDPFNPEQATDAAEKELGNLYRKYNGSVPHMIAAWNWGQGNLDRHGLEKAPRETRNLIANMGADVPADMRAQGVQFARPSTGLPVTRIATEQGIVPALAAPSPTIPGSFLLEQLRQLEPGAAVKPPLLEEKWPAMGASTPGTSLMKASIVDPATGLIREGDMLSDVGAGTTEQLAPAGTLGRAAIGAGKEAAATGIQGVATGIGGAYGGPVGAAALSYAANQLNKGIGLTPGDPHLLPQDLGDYWSLLPGLPAVRDVGKWGFRQMRGPRALLAAEEQTAGATTKAQTEFQQKAFNAYEQAQTQTEIDQAKYAAQVTEKRAAMAEARRQEHTRLLGEQEKYDAAVSNRQVAQAEQEQRAMAHAQAKTQTDLAEYETTARNRLEQSYNEGVADTATERAAREGYDQTIQAQREAVQRARDLPGRYLPEVPKRTPADVQRDLTFLEAGGAEERAVIQRLDAEDIFDAAAKLRAEAQELRGTGAPTTPLPGQPIPPSYRRATPQPADQGLELQEFIRKPSQGKRGIRIAGDEIETDAAGYITPGQVGRESSLLNNKSGWTLDEMAQRAAEEGYIRSPDKKALLGALSESQGGRPVYSRQRTVEAPTEQAYLPPSMRPSEAPELHRASGVVYERLAEVAPNAPVNMQLAKIAAADVQAQLGEGLATLPPSGLRKVVQEILEMGDSGSVSQAHSMLKQLRQAGERASGTQRHLIRQLNEGLNDALEASADLSPATAEALPLLRQARQMYRQEAAVGDLQRIARQSMRRDPVTKEWKIDTAAFTKRFDDLVDHPTRGNYFRQSFSPDDFASLQSDMEGFFNVPGYPKGTPPPQPTMLPGRIQVSELPQPEPQQVLYGNKADFARGQREFVVEPLKVGDIAQPESRMPSLIRQQFEELRGMQPPAASQVRFVDPNTLPPGQRQFAVAPYEAPSPVEPELRVPSPGRLLKDVFYTATPVLAGTRGLGTAAAVGATVAAGDLAMYGLAKLMISPRMRPMVMRMLQQSGGRITPQIYGLLGAAAAEEGRE
jgi:hypothetical protein